MPNSIHAALAAADPTESACAAALTTLGFRDPENAWRDLRRMARALPRDAPTDDFYRSLEATLHRLHNPDRALHALERLLGDALEAGELVRALAGDEAGLERLLRVSAASEFLANAFARDATLVGAVLLDGRWDVPIDAARVSAAWDACRSDAEDVDGIARALRRFKRRMLAHIGAQDILGVATVDETLTALTRYAECCLEAAYSAVDAATAARYGQPRAAATGQRAGFCVLALGKLGGAELNYSSDIDLLFVYGDSGETAPTAEGQPISNAEYFSKVGRELIHVLTGHDWGGPVFRVDMRLRPMGAKGLLANPLDAMLEYYESWGRTWERQMLIKARPVAGDRRLGESLLQELRPFIYPKYLDLKAIREVHDLKRTIEHRTETEGDPALDVKTGYGGIRDIEFTVQFLQLLNGGRRPALRTGNTLDGIRALREEGLLPVRDADALAEAYRFLRRAENRLQLWADLQRHRLPSAASAQQAFAADLGYAAARAGDAWTGFDRDYRQHTGVARRVFKQILGDPFEEMPTQAPVRELFRVPDPVPDLIARALAPYALRDPLAAWGHLDHLAFGPRNAPLTPAAQETFTEICPLILQHVAGTPDPDHTLQNVRACLDTFGSPGAFYDLLRTRPKAIEVFVALASFSETLIRILLADPGMLDFLIRDTMLEHASKPRHIKRGLDRFLEINPDFHTALRRYKNGEVLRIGLRDMLGLAPIAEVTTQLSAVADTVIDHLWAHEAAELTRRYGSPLEADGATVAESVVLGLGKCGGQDLNYTSDLDVAFVYSRNGETAGEMEAPISAQEYFLKLAARVTKRAVEAGPYGFLYKLDARLRPDGAQGVLATAADTYLAYYRDRARPWEHQALLRLRPIAGNLALGRQIVSGVHDIIYAPDFWRPDLVDEVDAMLRKLQAHRLEKSTGLALKNEVGGIVELEFLVQLLMLRYGAAHPSVREPNTLRALTALQQIDALPAAEAQALINAYEFLRRTENRLRIMFEQETARLPDDARARDRLAMRLGVRNKSDLPDGEVLLQTVEATFHRVHAIYDRTVQRLRQGARA